MDVTRRTIMTGAVALSLARRARAAGPQRIVSLNPCLDTILVRLVVPGRIAALSHYARDAHSSTIATLASALPSTYETAEEVAALTPDLVLASRHNAPATRNAMTKLGIPFALFGVPDTVEDSLAQIGEIARLCAAEAQGAALVAEIRTALADAAPPPGMKPIKAVVFQSRGFAAGENTLVGEMLRRCGFENVAARYGLTSWGTIPLEVLIADPPDLLLSGTASEGAPSWGERVLSHPALKALAERMARAEFPESLLYCGGPVLLKSAAALKAARDAYWSHRS